MLVEYRVVRNRSQGHVKTSASLTDHQAWNLDADEWKKYFLEQKEGSPPWERVGSKYK
jgi:hypothetical protein